VCRVQGIVGTNNAWTRTPPARIALPAAAAAPRGLFRVLGGIDADDVEVAVRRTIGNLAGIAGRPHRGARSGIGRFVAKLHDHPAGR